LVLYSCAWGRYFSVSKMVSKGWWLMAKIPVTWEAEIRRIEV
jgi:hypothetical protein